MLILQDILGKKCIDKFKCNPCANNLIVNDFDNIMNDEKQLLIINKDYSKNIQHLKYPTDEFKTMVDVVSTSFSKTFLKKPYINRTKLFIKNKIFRKLSKKCPIFHNEVECREHMEFIVDQLTLCKLHKECKNES